MAGMARQGVLGTGMATGMGTGVGTVPLLLLVEANLPSPPLADAQERHSWVCCLEMLPLLFEVLREYNLVFPDSHLPHTN